MPKLNFSSKKTQTGFTLIEILIVVTIISITVAIGSITYSGAQRQARNDKRQADLKKIAGALENFFSDNDVYPNPTQGTACLAGTGSAPCNIVYLQKVPVDPQGQPYTYIPAQAKNATGCQKFTLSTSSIDGTVPVVTDQSPLTVDGPC